MPQSKPFRRSLIPISVAFALLGLVVALAVWTAEWQGRSVDDVRHTLVVENRLVRFLSVLQDAETGQRGFLLSGDPSYLEPYLEAERRLPEQLTELANAVSDNTRQQRRLARLRDVVAFKLVELRGTLALARSGDRPGAIARFVTGEGKARMDEARHLVQTMVDEEQGLLNERQRHAESVARLLKIGLVIAFALVILIAWLTIRDSGTRLHEALVARDQVADEMARREASEAQLRQVQKIESVGQLTAGIAHDFNNMLAVVIGSLDLARRKFDGDGHPATRNIDHAMAGARRAATLTARLLAFARQTPLTPASLQVNRLVAGMSELLRRTLGETVQLETVLAGGLWLTKADAGQLENVVVNLGVNARHALGDRGGKLTVETANCHLDDAYARANPEVVPGQYVMIAVSDTGSGMSPEVMARAFDPFFTTKGSGDGTGLGLSQVYGYAKQSGGHVKIYSEPEQGTTIKLYLPRYFGVEEERPSADDQRELAGTPRPHAVILVVEDDDDVRRFSVEALRGLGYTVIHASGGEEALTVLDEKPGIRLLFTDVVMPMMNGRELAERATAKNPDLKILYTTGYTRNAVVHNGTLDPGVMFIPKPFTVDQLAAKVQEVLTDSG